MWISTLPNSMEHVLFWLSLNGHPIKLRESPRVAVDDCAYVLRVIKAEESRRYRLPTNSMNLERAENRKVPLRSQLAGPSAEPVEVALKTHAAEEQCVVVEEGLQSEDEWPALDVIAFPVAPPQF